MPTKPFASEQQRYEYPLNENSCVIDAGAYHGEWSEEIMRRYNPRILAFEPLFTQIAAQRLKPHLDSGRVTLVDKALGGSMRKETFAVQENSSGMFGQRREKKQVEVWDVDVVLPAEVLPIHLIKLNVEGMEYEILDRLLEKGKIAGIENLQVQFHGGPDGANIRWFELDKRIQLTHEREWGHDAFIWLSYRKANAFPDGVSQSGQDKFAFLLLGRDRTFLDIGCSHPKDRSNTWALEQMGWTGLALDSEPNAVAMWPGARKTQAIVADATNHYFGADYDYLSLDVDAASLKALHNLANQRIRFSVLTVEHNRYSDGETLRTPMRELLRSEGYKLIAEDVTDQGCEYEDWWVSAELEQYARRFKSVGKNGKEIVA